MQHLCWVCWLFWVGLPILAGFPVSSIRADLPHVHASSQWERYWVQYTIGLLSLTATAVTLVGCLCCRRPRRPKGFQDKAETCEQEFKDGNSIGQETAFERTVEGLELDVPRMIAIADRVQFEPLPVDRIISSAKSPSKAKPLPLSTTFYEDANGLKEPCRDWFDAEELYVPRENLKYLREIGHGWFGKVVEGRADLERNPGASKSSGVVVRILTEEATTREKVWFLSEATPYLKLRHQNVLALLGFCLETDPYLLLFESCLAGDLKGFLLSNRDKKSQEALKKENIPSRMALDITAGLKHMHNHGFMHTDLSARNCLVASDLSAKLGDYGTGVEKYPDDYYVVGDRALPIRWSAPESIECTETTIETREITSQANMWSYAVLLWEIATWGNRPYNETTDEQVIEMLLSLKTDLSPNGTRMLQTYLENCPSNMLQVIRLCLNVNPKRRPNLDEVKTILLSEQEYFDFEHRWESLRTNSSKHHRSASLQDLRGSIDSDYWTTIADDLPQETQSSFRLGPDEPVKNVPDVKSPVAQPESGSETEEESWKGRIEKGVYTEKVKQKSKSVTDLMVLVHIDFDSDAEVSLGGQVEKQAKKKFSATGSDGELRPNARTDEFNEALRKLRDPLPSNAASKMKLLDNSERPKLLTLTVDQGQTPILRLSLDESSEDNANAEPARADKHVLRLLSKDPDLPLLRYVPDDAPGRSPEGDTQPGDVGAPADACCFSNDFSVDDHLRDGEDNLVDVVLWNHALDSALEQKIPGFADQEFAEYESAKRDSPEVNPGSAPDTPQSRRDYSVYNADDEFSNGEDLDAERRCLPTDEEEERKQLSTPDDEQSSDSGFRDKESCEEEESVCPSAQVAAGAPAPECMEEEQLQILFELDTILDAEYYSTLPGEKAEDSLSSTYVDKSVSSQQELAGAPADAAVEDAAGVSDLSVVEANEEEAVLEEAQSAAKRAEVERPRVPLPEQSGDVESETMPEDVNEPIQQDVEQCSQEEYEHEDEDSSTMSLRSDNSYVSFGMEEEFVTAIRNELREKLPCAQMAVVEPLESRDDDAPISNDKQWDDEDSEESSNQGSGVGISIRYNVYGTPLSPIQEERESTVTSESLMSNSRDASLASKDSVQSDDVLLIDTRTNKMILLEGLEERLQDDDRDTTNGDISEEENLDYNCSITRSGDSKTRIRITSGGAPLPSPEEESKWQQLQPSFPLPLQDDLMSTSFATEHGWGSQDDDDDEEEEEDEEEEDEDNSSSSGEFVWKRYDEPHVEQLRSSSNNDEAAADTEAEVDAEEEDEDEEEEEFTPSAWNATLAPHRSALRSPDKTIKSGDELDQKKSVWFKKQRYHCVYEYPKETLATDSQGEATTTWEPTSYADWEEMMDEPRLDLYPLDYDDANHTGNEEFFVSSSNRPFQFQTGDSKYVSQFFPGAVSTSANEEHDEVDGGRQEVRENNNELLNDYGHGQQLGELRHTRDRLKLNLCTNGAPSAPFVSVKQQVEEEEVEEEFESNEQEVSDNSDFVQDQCNLANSLNDNTLPKVPREETKRETISSDEAPTKSGQCDSNEKTESTDDKCSVLARDLNVESP